jgi:DNA-binding PadR family transcriptional regulator
MSTYWKDGEPNWRRMEAMARRGWGRFAAGVDSAENWGNMGGNFRIGRMLASGDLRLVALFLIEEQPRHGYDLIKAIEERSAGFYSPSPGVVYPALTYLEEAGYATAHAEANKKLYTITEEGRAHLSDNREAIQSTLAFLAKAGEQMQRFREFARADWSAEQDRAADSAADQPSAPEPDRDLKDVVPELNQARRALKAAIKTARCGSQDQQHRAAAILRRAAAEVEALSDDEVDL